MSAVHVLTTKDNELSSRPLRVHVRVRVRLRVRVRVCVRKRVRVRGRVRAHARARAQVRAHGRARAHHHWQPLNYPIYYRKRANKCVYASPFPVSHPPPLRAHHTRYV